MKKVILSILALTLLSGCSVFQGWYGETKPMMTYAELPSESKLFVWSPKNNAAFVNSQGQGCVQGAEVFHEKSGSVDVSNELLGLIKGIELSPDSSSEEKALAVNIANEIVNLRTNTERNTYLSIGMFGLCQLQANGGVTNEDLLQLVSELIKSSLEVGLKAHLSSVSTNEHNASQNQNLSDVPIIQDFEN
ncbi:membrane lipoprotein lipid attachment site-containing protein [Pseudoalteromonas phenolica]|uniref:Lipoprotein n=1 Tax=Pseudoalteromonas phenolica TaxID=161398 RepID=A0A0S2JXV0_9GAMM|nr:membrane lipoprotein lipid attachment site-containing protein [Pseudoalteromonas phenolica]ALO40976.1 hypothetical protein PP2015_453 [Pseudoalteromonas phenolica]MBE0354502.1 hypothetical protein [Pseudoalteromonas phenolica O-BC30]RXE96006.1 hypothetical protein D9981_13355 [Pseudoalteromonas phenolica O-BC30]TMO55187.1 hypothetical protein CWC21_12350 [Pseudoalteromonas phenolica]